MPFQDSPRSTAPIVVWFTPNNTAISRWSMPVAAWRFLMDFTFSRVRARALPGDSAADAPLPMGEMLVEQAGTQALLASTSRTEDRGTPRISDISRLSRSSTLARRLISKAWSALRVLPFRCPSAQVSLPAPKAWDIFSKQDTHSRLLDRLLDLFRSLWFTCGFPSGGSPMKARATCRCVWVSFCLPSAYSPICRYPLELRNGFKTLGGPLRIAAFRLSTVVLNLPRLLTSYPAYPTTGSHFSSSIFNLSSGLKASLRWVSNRVTSGLLGTPPEPSGSVQRLRRHVGWPGLGAFPALGQVCRS